MKPGQEPPATRYTLFDRLGAALVSMAWLLLPLGIYWVLFDRFLIYAGYPWLLGGRAFFGIMAVTGVLGFAFPRVIPDLVGALWDGIMGLVRRWWWWV